MNGLLCLLNSKYMALHFKPNEAVTDIEVSIHYKEYCLENTRQRHREIWGGGEILQEI